MKKRGTRDNPRNKTSALHPLARSSRLWGSKIAGVFSEGESSIGLEGRSLFGRESGFSIAYGPLEENGKSPFCSGFLLCSSVLSGLCNEAPFARSLLLTLVLLR